MDRKYLVGGLLMVGLYLAYSGEGEEASVQKPATRGHTVQKNRKNTRIPALINEERQHTVSKVVAPKIAAPMTFATMEKVIDGYRDKALFSADELTELQGIANSPTFQHTIYAALKADRVKVFAFSEEKKRFTMQDRIATILRHGSRESLRDLQAKLSELVLSDSYKLKTDDRLKKSLLGDKIDYLRTIKRHFPERFATVKSQIEATQDRALLFVLSKV